MAQRTQAECYEPDGTPKVCPECGHGTFTDEVKSSIDMGVPGGGLPCEIEYRCAACKTSVAYWAYGHFDSAYRIGTDEEL